MSYDLSRNTISGEQTPTLFLGGRKREEHTLFTIPLICFSPFSQGKAETKTADKSDEKQACFNFLHY